MMTTEYEWLPSLEENLLEAHLSADLVDFIKSCLVVPLPNRPSLQSLLGSPLFSTFKEETPLIQPNIARVSLSEQFQLWRINGNSIEAILSKRGISSIPSIERLPLYISVSTTDDFVACMNPENVVSGIYQDKIHVFDVPILDPREVDAPSFSSGWKGLSEGWPHPSSKKSKPRKPLALKERNAVYQYFRVLKFKQIVKEFPLSKTDLWAEAALDIPPLVRGLVWCCLLDVHPFVTVEYDFIDKNVATVADRQLELDIPRCHQYNELISSPLGHAKLERILKSWVITETPNQNVYWQGLDSLLAPFLALNFTNEARAYLCFKAFISKYFDGFFKEDNSAALNRCMNNVKYVMSFLDAQLAGHLMELGITPDMFAIPWVMTMFARACFLVLF
ncbi:UNVERIFIED_CONTAM: hypothetical protein HDU68_011560 [Siphonaria sp. JEL0065]|nr:hypothetical protein HDU68_011560 [Siphonaria sp. JEL0065]